MYKSALRSASRATLTPRNPATARSSFGAAKRFASSNGGSGGRRTWKSGAARWMTAGAAVYWYNTSDYFKEDSEAAIQRTTDSLLRIQESDSPTTIDAIVEEKRARAAERVAEDQKRLREAEASAAAAEEGEASSQEGEEEGEGGMEGLEEEADQQGAFNPETGEINWDCPCLGGMAHGPCGPEFKEAFSCFVHSTEEPKGVECIEKFKGMQDCFRLHPEMYGSELDDDEDEVEEELRAQQSAKDGESEPVSEKETESIPKSEAEATEASEPKKVVEESHRESRLKTPEGATKDGDEGGELVPKAAHDATSK